MTLKEFMDVIRENSGNLKPEEGEGIFCVSFSKGDNQCLISGNGKDIVLSLMLNALDNESIRGIIGAVEEAVKGCNKAGIHSSKDLLKKLEEREKNESESSEE